ncbi:MAG TPA: ATP-binding protein [Ignisphaera aggregans]|uniref:ATP-binding protein n=1 Tax=Ignisphaera aggregans TaxID=334771 RepID=A0A832YWU2_9CREN|nr:ATP-binding protein [Ignisphaera aggregans]
MSRAYLEALARRYLNDALTNEKVGNIHEAAKYYRKAAEILMLIANNYPSDPLAKMYRELADSYMRKAKELERSEIIPVSSGPTKDMSESDIVEEFIVKEKPRVRFEDIIGLDEAKQAIIDSIVYPSKRPDLFPLGWPRGILLYGPPGCGKTMLAAAVANEVDGVFMHIDAANIMSKWLGEAEKRVAMIFRYAYRVSEEQGKPVIIFIDEADALLGVYEHEIGGEARVRNQFLKEMDGLNSKSAKHLVYVIAATNKPWKLDIGFLRRFQRRIYVPPPNRDARRALFEYYTRYIRVAPDVDFDLLADRTEGYSASDIRDVVMEAHLITIRELFKSGNIYGEPRPVTMNDFLYVISRRRPSISRELLKLYEEWSQRFGGTL